MAKKVNLGFGERTASIMNNKETSSPSNTESADSVSIEVIPQNNGLVDGLFPKEAPAPVSTAQRTKYIPYELLYMNKLNEGLSLNEIEALANTIEIAGLQQPLVVIQDEKGMYRIISGHRRYLAITKLKDENRWSGKVECKVIDLSIVDLPISDELKERYLIKIGNLYRNKNKQDRYFDLNDWKDIYNGMKAAGVKTYKSQFDGIEYQLTRCRDFIQKNTGLSSGDLARMEKIQKYASDEVIQALKDEEITINAASELASFNKEEQKEHLKNKDADINANYNFSKKILNKDLNPIRKKIGSGVNLSDEDMSEYKKCMSKLQEILEKY